MAGETTTWPLPGFMCQTKGRSHGVLLPGRHPKVCSDLSPLTHDPQAVADDRLGITNGDAKVRCHGPSEIEVDCIVVLADVQFQSMGVRDRIHVKGRRQTPPLAGHQDEAMISQMVVGVGNQQVENDPRPQLPKIGVGLRAVIDQGSRDLKVARAC